MITADHGEDPGRSIKQPLAELQIVRQQLALAQQQLVAHQEHIDAKSPKQALVQKLDFEYNNLKLDEQSGRVGNCLFRPDVSIHHRQSRPKPLPRRSKTRCL